jgi:serine phosphatase RsbU (regulator of sigma subunit)
MSLKLKFQLAIVLMISIVTIVTVQITKSIYSNDKLTSVYEKATLQQEALKNQILFLRELAEAKALRFTELYMNNKSKKNEVFKEFLRDPMLLGLEVNSKKEKILNLLKEQEASILGLCTSAIYKNIVCHEFEAGNLKIKIAFDLSDVQRRLTENNDLKTYLVINKKIPIEIPEEIVKTTDLTTNGASTYQSENFLISSFKSTALNFQIVSFMTKSRAFAEITELTKKIFFAATIIGTTCLIFGILLANGLTSKLKELAEYSRTIAVGDFSKDFIITDKDEVGDLGRAFGKMKNDLVYYIEEQKTKVRMQHELEVAQVVQRNFFSAPRSSSSVAKVVNQFHPASECGGDWCFVHHLGHGTLFGIGDATGHGAGAALTTAAVYSGMKIISNIYQDKKITEIELSEAIQTLNMVINMPDQGQLMTFVLGYIPKDSAEMFIVNQGHHSPIIIDTTSGEVHALPLSPSDRLGEKKEIEPVVQKIPFSKNLICLLITDGLIELKKSDLFSLNRNKLIRDITKSKPENSDALASLLEEKIQKIKELKLNEDDICYVIAVRSN